MTRGVMQCLARLAVVVTVIVLPLSVTVSHTSPEQLRIVTALADAAKGACGAARAAPAPVMPSPAAIAPTAQILVTLVAIERCCMSCSSSHRPQTGPRSGTWSRPVRTALRIAVIDG
jgi:hypothetical protein